MWTGGTANLIQTARYTTGVSFNATRNREEGLLSFLSLFLGEFRRRNAAGTQLPAPQPEVYDVGRSNPSFAEAWVQAVIKSVTHKHPHSKPPAPSRSRSGPSERQRSPTHRFRSPRQTVTVIESRSRDSIRCPVPLLQAPNNWGGGGATSDITS